MITEKNIKSTITTCTTLRYDNIIKMPFSAALLCPLSKCTIVELDVTLFTMPTADFYRSNKK